MRYRGLGRVNLQFTLALAAHIKVRSPETTCGDVVMSAWRVDGSGYLEWRRDGAIEGNEWFWRSAAVIRHQKRHALVVTGSLVENLQKLIFRLLKQGIFRHLLLPKVDIKFCLITITTY